MTHFFDRSERLLGPEAMERLARARVIIFGVGGVGSWAAEALVRTGLGHITIVDFDTIAESNVNRQRPATAQTIGLPKVEVMARLLREISPQCDVRAIGRRYTPEAANEFHLEEYNVVIDAIDSVADKADLILRASRLPGVTLLSSMGAARKTDPLRVQLAQFDKAIGCPLAAALRQRFKRLGRRPGRFRCVFSTEVLPAPDDGGPNGSIMLVTATWGLTLASAAIQAII